MAFELLKVKDGVYEIPRQGLMRVPGRVYASESLLKSILNDPCLQQVVNVATLPGIQGYSIAMPDIHWGYGFPIGGVAAMDLQEGVVSPGGVGYDINCGVRLSVAHLSQEELLPRIERLADELYFSIPAGLGSSRAIGKLSVSRLKELCLKGAAFAVEEGFGFQEDLEFCEEGGRLKGADPEIVSMKALERGASQVGTLGSGNHFLEVGVAETLFEPALANAFGIEKNQVYLLIHSGSRGFGHQVCEDFLKVMEASSKKYGIHLPDRQLCCAPIPSEEGQRYLRAMAAAANFAWANRQVMLGLARKAFAKTFETNEASLGIRLIYDVSHNIAKIEEHTHAGRRLKVCVHRKGATRSFPKNHPLVPKPYSSLGQPVIIPGDMGRYSYLLIGTDKVLQETFGSSAHGAGRFLSRHSAIKKAKGRSIIQELKDRGILVMARDSRTIAEEMSEAYKDVEEVVDALVLAGLARKVVRFRPLCVLKG